MQQELIILGIDPGITTAYAILNIKGEILRLKSSRTITLNQIIYEVSQVGKVILLGCDVKYPPEYSKKLATKLNAKLVAPDNDLKVGFKERLTSDFKTNDSHQRDSLAAALYAYSEHFQILKRINEHLKAEGKEHISDRVRELVILESLSIHDAIEKLEEKPDEIKSRKRIRNKIKRSFLLSYENNVLKKKIESLTKEIEYLNKCIEEIKVNMNKNAQEKSKEIINLKDKKIYFLENNIKNNKNEIDCLKLELLDLKSILLNSKDLIIINKIPDLSWDESFKYENHDFLYVENPHILSNKTLEKIRNVKALIYGTKTAPKNLSEITLINKSELDLIERRDFIMVNKGKFEDKLKSKDNVYKIIEDYKEERIKELIQH